MPSDVTRNVGVVFPIWIWDEYSDVSQILSVEQLETCNDYRSAYACVDARGNWHEIKWNRVGVGAGPLAAESRSTIAGWFQKVLGSARGEATYTAQFHRGPNAQYLRDDLIGRHHPLKVIADQQDAEDMSRRIDSAYSVHSIYISETIDLDFGVHGELAGYRIERPLESLAKGILPLAKHEHDRKAVALSDRFDEDGALELNEVGFSEDLNLGNVHYDSSCDVVWAGAISGEAIEAAEGLVVFLDVFSQIIGVIILNAVIMNIAR